ncbi:odorant receptor 67a-like isoform X2 [Venturia canescens]|uniref:odorant receptor 67a-like isoform X2 n=1 Tax=Venturia canescens TaxID=32260 RepID=UPI001C9BC474|nr:odorant receptor 67a-like isoform X2 [Venturia canescens]
MDVLKLDDNYLNFNIQTLMVLVWNPFKRESRYDLLYKYYGIGLFCLAGLPQMTASVMHAWSNKNDMVALTQNFTIVAGMASTLIKVVNLWQRQTDVKKLVDLLNYERRQPCYRKFAIYREKIVTGTIRICKLFSLTFIVMVFWYAVFLYGRILVYHKGNVDMLPLSPIVRCPPNKTSLYWLLFIYDATSFCYIAGAVASQDSLFMVFLIHLATQLDLVEQRLIFCHDKLGPEYEAAHIEKVIDRQDFKIECVCRSNVEQVSIDPVTELQICIEHHQQIIRCVNLVQSIFNHTLLLQFATSLVMITMTGFQLVAGRRLSSNEFIEQVTLFLCALFQLFIYCWFGTDIIAKKRFQSQSLNTSAYNSKWYIADERFKKTLKILMCKGQVPIKIRVGYVFELSSTTFMNASELMFDKKKRKELVQIQNK